MWSLFPPLESQSWEYIWVLGTLHSIHLEWVLGVSGGQMSAASVPAGTLLTLTPRPAALLLPSTLWLSWLVHSFLPFPSFPKWRGKGMLTLSRPSPLCGPLSA